MTAILLLPSAVEMLYEKQSVHNLFSVLGGVRETPDIRAGAVRANGPFGHPILVGTGEKERIAQTVAVLRRALVVLGILSATTQRRGSMPGVLCGMILIGGRRGGSS